MGLTEEDKMMIAEFIREEIKRINAEIAKSALDVRIPPTNLGSRSVFVKQSKLEADLFNKANKPSMSFEEQAESIRVRQIKLPNLIMDGGISAHFGNGLSAGCRACKNNRWVTVFIGKACNAKCTFCPQPPKPSLGDNSDNKGIISTSFGKEYYSQLLRKLLRAAERKSIDAIGYSGGEPLLYLERIIEYASILNAEHPELYQYIYTNGLLVAEENLKKLRDVGIMEVRYNLAATNFSKKVIDKMVLSKKIIPFLTVEVPALRGIAEKIKEHIEQFIDIGVDQINLCEVVINEYNWTYFKSEPYYIINPYECPNAKSIEDPEVDVRVYRRVVPTWSRHEAYDVLEMAHKYNWPMVINDCSQGIHYKDRVPY